MTAPVRVGPPVNDDDLRARVNTERLRLGLLTVTPLDGVEAAAVLRGARQVLKAGQHPTELHEYVALLCDPTIHEEAYTELYRNSDGSTTYVRQRHRTTSPALLVQLWGAVEQSGSAEGGQRVFASKPSARLDAIDAALDVEKGVFGWLTRLGERPDTMRDIIAGLRHIGSLAISKPKPVHNEIEADVRSWWVRASVLTGWESPAFQPNNTCPMCGTRGSLRIRLAAHTAVCVSCRETWDPVVIGLLAEHIRRENDPDAELDDDADTA